ncbi:MAG: ABC transporter ATP-binding protein [Rhizobiaceae bacterium]
MSEPAAAAFSGHRTTTAPLLEVRSLSIGLTGGSHADIVGDVTFSVGSRSIFGIVGESGCGKSVTAMSILGLNQPGIAPKAGQVLFKGEDVLKASDRRLRQIRGDEISMIFQEPLTSLNPVLTVGYQIVEALRSHRSMAASEARARAVELLSMVGIPSPETRLESYPHQLSGGMCQRVMIALALACQPELLIADEPTTALDVTIQAQIIDLLRGLQRDLGMSVIIITHDLALLSDFAETIAVMYAGRVVELASAELLFSNPAHPYTERLLASIPPVDRDVERLATIEGRVPGIAEAIQGCRFAARCPFSDELCRSVEPQLKDHGGGLAACHHPRRRERVAS